MSEDKKVEEWKFYGYLITFLLSFFGGSILAFVMPESLFGSLLSLFNFNLNNNFLLHNTLYI